MKYIDADLLRKEIEEERKSIEGLFIKGDNNFYDGQDDAYNHTLALIDSLQQEQPELPQIERAEYYYHKGVYEGLSQGRADALKMLDEFMKRNANPVIVIKQQEQPEMDLENYISNKLFELGADLINHKPYSFNRGLNVGKANAYHDILDRLNVRKDD